jgi:hypothetical protein
LLPPSCDDDAEPEPQPLLCGRDSTPRRPSRPLVCRLHVTYLVVEARSSRQRALQPRSLPSAALALMPSPPPPPFAAAVEASPAPSPALPGAGAARGPSALLPAASPAALSLARDAHLSPFLQKEVIACFGR